MKEERWAWAWWKGRQKGIHCCFRLCSCHHRPPPPLVPLQSLLMCSPTAQFHSFHTPELRLLHLWVDQLGEGQSTRGGHRRGSNQRGSIDLQEQVWRDSHGTCQGPGVQPRAAGAILLAHWYVVIISTAAIAIDDHSLMCRGLQATTYRTSYFPQYFCK